MMKPGDLVRTKCAGPNGWPQLWRTKKNYSELANIYQEDVGLILRLSDIPEHGARDSLLYWEVLVGGVIIYIAENYLEIIHN